MLKFLVKVFFDAYISTTFQGTCLMFGMDLPESIGFCYINKKNKKHVPGSGQGVRPKVSI